MTDQDGRAGTTFFNNGNKLSIYIDILYHCPKERARVTAPCQICLLPFVEPVEQCRLDIWPQVAVLISAIRIEGRQKKKKTTRGPKKPEAQHLRDQCSFNISSRISTASRTYRVHLSEKTPDSLAASRPRGSERSNPTRSVQSTEPWRSPKRRRNSRTTS